MTREQMKTKLNRCDGIGVKATDTKDDAHYFFYEDFSNNDGIDRAMKQMYAALDKGIYKSVEFIAKGN